MSRGRCWTELRGLGLVRQINMHYIHIKIVKEHILMKMFSNRMEMKGYNTDYIYYACIHAYLSIFPI